MNRFELTLDLDKRGGVAQWVTLRQGDHNGTELRATIYDHGTQAGGGYTCRVSIRLPGAGDEYYRETATYTNGVAVVTVDEEYAAAIVGVTEGYFELLQGDAVIASTESFGVRILRSAQDGAVPGDKYDSAIEDALAELDEATGRISQMVVDATAEYLEAHPELTTTVEDNSLTDAKLIQHGGILDRVARLWHRLDNLLTATPAEADALTVTDAAKTPLAGLALYGRSTQDGTPTPSAPVAIQSVTPNLYDSANEPSRTHNGVTWTTSAAGIKAVGTASGVSYIKGTPSALTDADMTFLPAGTYTVTNHDGATMAAWVYVGSVSSYTQVMAWGTAASTTFTVPDGGGYFRISLRVASGTTVDTTYRVSLNEGSSAAAGFVPYGYVGLYSHGPNIWQGFSSDVSVSSSGLTGRLVGTHIKLSGTTTDNNNDTARCTFNAPIRFKGGQEYTVTLSGTYSSGTKAVILWKNDGTTTLFNSGSSTDGTWHFTPAADYDVYGMTFRIQGSGTVVNIDADMQVEVGSVAHAYAPYAESTTPIDLQGHALRSLPDGTRDEVTVDQYGNAVLIQRVGVATVDGTYSNMSFQAADAMGGGCSRITLRAVLFPNMVGTTLNDNNCLCTHATYGSTNASATPPEGRFTRPANSNGYITLPASLTTGQEAQAWLTDNPVTFYAPLDEPVTIDLGTIDPVALQGPDMTAQSVPTAPFALTYERDLNVTLARLEASIADAATS